MSEASFEIREIDGLYTGRKRRLVFLVAPTGHSVVNAYDAFVRLDKKGNAKQFRYAFDLWLKGFDGKSKRHHGWDARDHGGKYKQCHVFKQSRRRAQERLYGFKCHPFSDSSIELCVLVYMPKKFKKQHAVDTNNLDRCIGLETEIGVVSAIKAYAKRTETLDA